MKLIKLLKYLIIPSKYLEIFEKTVADRPKITNPRR